MSGERCARRDVAIAVSVGGTKVACGAVTRDGRVLESRPAVPTPGDERSVLMLLADEARAVADAVGHAMVYGVGVSYPECVPPPGAFASDAPPTDHPLVARIDASVRAAVGRDTRVAVVHDAAAAVLGEVGAHGTVAGARDATFIVWGTGVASGVVRGGALYWNDPVVGHMVSEAGGLVVRRTDGGYDFRASADWPELARGAESLDGRLCGPALGRRAAAMQHAWSADASAGAPALAKVNAAARAGDANAYDFIVDAGREFGRALAAFITYWKYDRGEAFADNIVVGSGVVRMGDGLGDPPGSALQAAIQTAVATSLAARGIGDYDVEGVVVSALGHEREFLAFTPPWPGKKVVAARGIEPRFDG